MHLFLFAVVHNFLVAVSEILPIFAAKNVTVLVFVRCRRAELKRESGENPEQTRCCELRERWLQYFCHCFFVKKDGKAQHIGSEPEDLPRAIVIITLSRNRAYGFVGAFIVV